MTENTIHGLMKVGPSDFMKRLFDNGEVYLRELLWFSRLEEDNQRADKYEGSYMLKQIPYFKIKTHEGKEIELSTLGKGIPLPSTAKLRGHYNNIMANIYCMYGFDTKLCSKADFVDARISEFGDGAVLIFNPMEFLNRVKKALNDLGLEPVYGMVKYYDEETYESDNTLAFWKPTFFEHQNEFRIFVEREEHSDLILQIGPLNDIAEFHQIDTIMKMRFGILPEIKQFRFSLH